MSEVELTAARKGAHDGVIGRAADAPTRLEAGDHTHKGSTQKHFLWRAQVAQCPNNWQGAGSAEIPS